MTRKPFFILLILSVLLPACDRSPIDDGNLGIEGTWKGSVTSPTAPMCDRIIIMDFDQNGDSFTGTFVLLGDATGTFTGTIKDGNLSGDVTSQYDSCTGTGTFTGTITENRIEMYSPTMTTFDEGCEFCQQNTLVLTRQ